ncbi:MFS transporter [Streptomyces sp. GMY01]|uniref:MFS transporter n=1 Tax=Streptomyces sp. GMY02 TaxID=1333528 RepID=UPI00146DD387|nr:MFS transporter [Streptomyces sp. GMY02]NMO37333.1 MFS transporter [Streptomyces sp. GMY02]
MRGRRRLGRPFGWLWAAYAVSAYGSGLGFGAFPLIAVLALHAGPAEVSALSAVGPAVGALIAVPLAPWVEFRHKRPVMIGMDLARCAAMATIPVGYALGRLTWVQLLVVSVVVAAAKIAFNAASGAFLKALVRPDDLLVANARFESTNWSSIAVGPPLGGAAIGLFGPVVTVIADAFSYLLSALCLTAIGGREEAPRPRGEAPRAEAAARRTTGEAVPSAATGGTASRTTAEAVPQATGDAATRPPGEPAPPPARKGGPRRTAGLLDGWRHIMGHPVLRALYLNQLLVAGLIMATEPLLAVLLLRRLGFSPWQYGLAFAAPCLGGLVGSRLARRVVARHGRSAVFRTVGTLRAVWLIGLVFVRPGVIGLVTVMAVELAIIVNMSLYTPVLAAYRLEHTPKHLVARTLTAWSVGQQAAIALCTALGGLLADATGPRTALTAVGLLMLATPLLLPRPEGTPPASPAEPDATARAGTAP